MPAFDRDLAKFAERNAQVLDISVDTLYSHMAWQKHDIGTMHFPMCSDFYPHGDVAKLYGVFREGPVLSGISNRAVFIVDKNGKVIFSKEYPLDQVPDTGEILQALQKAE